MAGSQTPITQRLRVRVTAAAESILRAGHPWLFAESIRHQTRPGKLGELAVIYDRNDRFLAVGIYDPESPIRVRILHSGKPQTINEHWWSARMNLALERRQNIFDQRTTGFRWINGESDGWPGLVLDRYGRTLVMKLYSASWLPWLGALIPLFQQRLEPERLVLRLSRNIRGQAETQFGKADGELLTGPPLEELVVFAETGLNFEADVVRGQKTGFFLDQRENRRRVEALARGRTVLNAFSFSGGFSVYAARGGARSAMDLDLSAHALAGARRNFARNQNDSNVAACLHQVAQGDAFDWLRANSRRRFDLIILDPPSLARRESERAGAIRAYQRLAQLGIGRLAPGGILVACSCSAHVTAEEFFEAVRSAGSASKRRLNELETTQHPPDHPATFKEAEYLKAIYLRMGTA
jgi:23S rRNA (cytosine1962-C5)-methyltransferase